MTPLAILRTLETGIMKPQAAVLNQRTAGGSKFFRAGRSQPAVYRGRVFAGAQDGSVYALDAATGGVHWTTTVEAEVRSGIVAAEVTGKPAIFFGDSSGYLYSLDGATGKQLWKLRLDDHPAAKATSTPAFTRGGFM